MLNKLDSTDLKMFRDNRYVSNKEEVEIPAHLNYGKYILDRIRKQPKEKIALIDGMKDTKVTYGELTQFAVDLAVSLVELGTGRADVVAVCFEARDEFIPVVTGILMTGAAYTPLDLKVGRANLRYKLELTNPKHVIFSLAFWNEYKEILESYKFEKYITIDDTNLDFVIPIKILTSKNNDVHQFEPARVDGQKDIALILYSSGSTGYPKGILKTHLTCICNCLINSFKNPALKTSICFGEWCHSYDNQMTFKFLTAGRTVVYFGGEINVFLKCVQEYKPNIGFLYPSIIYEITSHKASQQYDFSSLQYVYCGTSALADDLKTKFMTRLPDLKTFISAYGMTETFELTSECWGEPGLKPKSVGKPGLRVTLKVVDLTTREPLGPNKLGEICADAHNIFKGYIGMEPSTYLDEEGFLRTGDLGYYDEDGYFFIVDRIKEIISYDGYKVSPLEIEMLLLKYPGVKDAAVVGKPVPDFGEEPTAFIVKEPGYNITKEEITDYIDYEAASHMKLRGGVIFVEQLPRNSIGKIIKPDLKKLLIV